MQAESPYRDAALLDLQAAGRRIRPDVAQVVQTGKSQCVPFKCYRGVTVIREGKANAPDNEFKYYAAGVGQIDNVPGRRASTTTSRSSSTSRTSAPGDWPRRARRP